MVIQGDSIIIKREDLSRKRDNKVEQAQEQQVIRNTAPEVAPVTFDYDDRYYLPFQSREETFYEILEALQDDSISRVGLFGEGGSGKTTLAKQVCKRAKELNIFNQIVFVALKAPPSVQKIQDKIADQLGLRLGEEATVAARRRLISKKFRNEQILIIVDPVHDRVDLREIGIWSDERKTGSKVILITHTREMVYLMGTQRSIHLYMLTDQEALHLLRKRAGIDNESRPDLTSFARKVTRLSNGNPFKLSMIGSALRSVYKLEEVSGAYDRYGWGEGSKFMYKMLQLNYNELRSKLPKAILLMCAWFPDDEEILTDDLFQLATRLRLCSGMNEVSAAINTLKDSFFLMHPGISNDRVMKPTYANRFFVYLDDSRIYLKENFQQLPNKLDRLLCQMLGVSTDEYPSSSTSSSNAAAACYGPQDQLQVPRPLIRKRVDFHGLCQVDESFLPLLKKACSVRPKLIETQRRHSPELRETAFDSLGRLLFMLHTVRKRDWANRKDELRMFWEQAQVMKFDLKWLKPVVEEVLCSTKLARIEALEKKAEKLRKQLKVVEDQIANEKSKLDDFAIADFSAVLAVSRVTPYWNFFCRRQY